MYSISLLHQPKVHFFPDESSWISGVISEILVEIPDKNFSLVLSGGNTPASIYKELCKYKLNWKSGNIFLADERFVPGSHPDSNKKLVQETLLTPAKYHFWNTEEGSIPQKAVEEYEQELKKYGKPFDVVLLGIGPDGHTASLFPNSPALSEKTHLTATSETEEFAIKERLSMTYAALMNAKKIIFLLKGEDKKEVLDELLSGNKTPEEFPAKKILEHENVHVCFGK